MTKYIDAEHVAMTVLCLTRIYDSEFQRGFYDGMDRVLQIIADEPPADVAPVKRGEWVNSKDWIWRKQCSLCGYIENACGELFNFCPNCGAAMTLK